MESNVNEPDHILHDLGHLLRVYKDGRVHRLEVPTPVPPSVDQETGVESKDIIIFPDRGVGARLFRPQCGLQSLAKKLPLLVFIHGGGFCVQSTYGDLYHNYLNILAAQARTLIVSIEYRLAPEHPLPAAYHDCWDALDWIVSHSVNGLLASSTQEPWLLDLADFSRVFLGGDSAGGNIAHNVALRVGKEGLANASIHSINGLLLSHPYFWGKDRIGNEANIMSGVHLANKVWGVVCPESSGLDDPWLNPLLDPTLSRLGCGRVLTFVAEMDLLRDRGYYYKEALEKSGWKGEVEVAESLGEGHVFHLINPSCPSANDMMMKVVEFLNPVCSNTQIYA